MGASPRRVGARRVITKTRLAAFSMPWRMGRNQPTLTVIVKARGELVPDGEVRLHDVPALPSGDRHRAGPQSSLLHPSDFALFKARCDIVLSGAIYPARDDATVRVAQLEVGADPERGIRRRIAVMGPRTWRSDVPSKPTRFERLPILYELCFGGASVDANPVGTGLAGTAPPNFEHPDSLLRTSGDRPPPVGFGAIAAGWPARSSKLGSYDEVWRSERFPYFPDDFDGAFFQAAPPEQQMDSVAAGAPYALVGMHPEHDTLRGTLPLWRPCCFAVRAAADAANQLSYQAVELKLDTVAFRPDELEVDLLWRGVIDVADNDASDIEELFVDIADAMPMELEQAAAAHGLQSELAQQLARAGGAAGVNVAGAIHPSQRPLPERVWPARDACPMRARALALLADDARDLRGVDLSGGELSELDFSGCDLSRANLRGARLVAAKLDGAALAQALLAEANLTDASLRGARLDQADLTGAVLEQAILAEASLNHVDLRGARGAGASFEGARGSLAKLGRGDWRNARFAEAELMGLDLSHADVSGAVFDDAVIDEIRLYEVRAKRASFRCARLNDARADEASLVECVFDRAQADGAVLDGADLRGSSFRGASLQRAGLVSADCTSAVFSGARLRDARLRRAVLDGAQLQGADLLGASLERADLRRADLTGSNLYGAELLEAQLEGAVLEGALVANTKLVAR